MSGLDSIVRKLESFSHQEFNTPEIKDPKRILERIRAGEDILKMGARFQLFSIDETFPKPMLSDPASYEHLCLVRNEGEGVATKLSSKV